MESDATQHKLALGKIKDAHMTVSALDNFRAKSLALTKLDEAFMWIKNDQEFTKALEETK